MGKFRANDRVKIVLNRQYTIEEIRDFGCHPDVNGKYAIVKEETTPVDGIPAYLLILETPMQPHEMHMNTDFTNEFTEYIETEDSLEFA
jgi:hypothetical protein